MQQTTPADIDPRQMLNNFEPLTKDVYPSLLKRPILVGDYQLAERNRIMQQEINYLKERLVFLFL
jgi:hypothetical protein